jgi:hypothetical protein
MATRCGKCGNFRDKVCPTCGQVPSENRVSTLRASFKIEMMWAVGLGLIVGPRGFMVIFGPFGWGLTFPNLFLRTGKSRP